MNRKEETVRASGMSQLAVGEASVNLPLAISYGRLATIVRIAFVNAITIATLTKVVVIFANLWQTSRVNVGFADYKQILKNNRTSPLALIHTSL